MIRNRVVRRLCMTVLLFHSFSACVEQKTTLSQVELGKRVEFVLRNATCIKIVATIHQVALEKDIELISGMEPITHLSFMAKNKFKSEIVQHGKLVAAYSLVDGRMQEYCPLLQNQPIFEYDPMYINGTGNVKYWYPTHCLVVWAHLNWVGVSPNAKLNIYGDPPSINADPPRAFRFIIEDGVRKADSVERGHDCYVYRIESEVSDSGIADVLYIDKQTSLVVRFDTFQPGVQRIRTYDITLLPEIPKDFEWRIKPSRDIAPQSEPAGVQWEIQVGK